MRDGFIKVAAVTPKVVVADVDHNKSVVWMAMQEQMATGTKICVFPELVLSAYTCNDLFFQRPLIEEANLHSKRLWKNQMAVIWSVLLVCHLQWVENYIIVRPLCKMDICSV